MSRARQKLDLPETRTFRRARDPVSPETEYRESVGKEFEERRERKKKKKKTIRRKIGKVTTVSFTTMHDPLNIVSGSLERFINGWPAEIHFPVPYSRRQTTRVPPPPYKPFLRNPSVKISISTFHSLHSIPCRGSPDPLTLFSVWTRSSKMQQQSAELVERTSKQRINRLPAWTPGMHARFSLSL